MPAVRVIKIAIIVTVVFAHICSSVFGAPNTKKMARSRFPSNFINTDDECNCECGMGNRHLRVVGGNDTQKHEFPWIAGLLLDGEFICGGTLITRRHIVTAAHCIQGFDTNQVSVVFGDHDREDVNRFSTTVIRGIERSVIHEDFNAFNYNNDIAILELDGPVNFDYKIQPACLPDSEFSDYIGKHAVVTGWGRLKEKSETSAVLQKVVVPIWSKEDCYGSGYGEFRITDNMFCAGYPEGSKDACEGDSGGPLNMKNSKGVTEIIGIVSWGRGCARPNLPGIYTKITNYMTWIHEAIQGECLCSAR